MIHTYAITIQGIVQGVGFRPFVYRLAKHYGIKGYVLNNNQGVFILAQAKHSMLQAFMQAIKTQAPQASHITTITSQSIQSKVYDTFIIQHTQQSHKLQTTAIIPPDLALCKDCLRELFDPTNRRYGYAFISCTQCGGRHSLIQKLPYKRAQTAMHQFNMCQSCQEEYEDPTNRRFHSEINCCQACGPQVFYTTNLNLPPSVVGRSDFAISSHLSLLQNPIQRAIEDLQNGLILALKGIGGYALICDATNTKSIQCLREKKKRATKPFAIMFPSIQEAKEHVFLSALQIQMLTSPLAPIMLAKTKKKSSLPLELIAPRLSHLGIILPYAPLHYLILHAFKKPIIYTSANQHGEHIITDFVSICEDLAGICDGVLFFNRDIFHPLDDSLVQIIHQKPQTIRRARGYALLVPSIPPKQNTLALGAQQKSTFTLALNEHTFLSPHLGDLNNLNTYEHFQYSLHLLCKNYATNPQTYLIDKHPHYWQRELIPKDAPICEVQHHVAHLFSNLAQHKRKEKTLGIIFDGTGYGDDGTLWGGEFILWDPSLGYQRILSFAPLSLLGGERAIKDIRRIALEMLFISLSSPQITKKLKSKIHQEQELQRELEALNLPFIQSLQKEFGSEIIGFFHSLHSKQTSPKSSSVGRLFDGVAALCGILEQSHYEGEGGMILQSLATWAIKKKYKPKAYLLYKKDSKIHWDRMIRQIIQDLPHLKLEQIALNFHYSLAISIAQFIPKTIQHIALSGGCFQNAILTELTLAQLKNYKVWLNHDIPCNDGGISYGQHYYFHLSKE